MARTRQTVRAVSSHSLSPKTKMKTSSNQRDLEDEFARMCLDHSSKSNKPPSSKLANKQKEDKSEDAIISAGYAPVVPPSLYRLLQEAVGYIEHLETHKVCPVMFGRG